jgi:hypothetical protein
MPPRFDDAQSRENEVEVTATTLREHYESLPSEKLLELQASGTLTVLAQRVIEHTLDERGVSYGEEQQPDKLIPNDVQSAETAWEIFCWTVVGWWGILFRTLFIPAVGIIGYFLVDPKSIGDVPFAQLTLNQVFHYVFGILIRILIAGGCLWWFFNFPDRAKAKSAEDNPYVVWGAFGGAVVLLAAMAYSYL